MSDKQPEPENPDKQVANNTTLPAGFGKSLKSVFQDHTLFVVLGIFTAGMALSAGMWGWFKPYMVDAEVRKLDIEKRKIEEENVRLKKTLSVTDTQPIAPTFGDKVKFPIKVTIMGETSGEIKSFGLSQVMGVVGGLLHVTGEVLDEEPDTWERYFTVSVIDTAPFEHDMDGLTRAFVNAQATSDVVFGPVRSSQAVELLINRNIQLRVPTILTTAATPRVRQHPMYGTNLFQVSPNIDVYSEQVVSYIASFMENRPKKIVCIYQDDEYGQSGNRAVLKYAAEHNIPTDSVVFSRQQANVPAEVHYEQLSTIIRGAASTWAGQEKEVVAIIISFGEDFRTTVKKLRSEYPNLRLATTTSVERDYVLSGDFDGVLVPYSFYPQQYSVYTLAFFKYMNQVRAYDDKLFPSTQRPDKWPIINTIHAEVHDATVYWFSTFVLPQLPQATNLSKKRLYVTDFSLKGSGQNFGNYGSLFLYNIKGTKMVPVELPN